MAVTITEGTTVSGAKYILADDGLGSISLVLDTHHILTDINTNLTTLNSKVELVHQDLIILNSKVELVHQDLVDIATSTEAINQDLVASNVIFTASKDAIVHLDNIATSDIEGLRMKPIQVPSSGSQRAMTINALQQSGQLQNVLNEMANPTVIPGF